MDSAKIFSLCKVTVVFLIIMFCVRITNAEEPEDVAWWESEMLLATGYGLTSFEVSSPAQARIFARKAAITDAYRQLAEKAGDIQITADERVTTKAVRAVIRGAKVLSEEYDSFNGIYKVVMSVPIYGVTNSIAKATLKPVEKEEFPTPEDDAVEIEGDYTGLILDCGDLELNPVMAPVVLNEDELSIYSCGNLEYDEVISKGMVSFVKAPEDDVEQSDEDTKVLGAEDKSDNLSRAGKNPLVVKVVSMTADNTCPVVSKGDADKILSENRVSHFLNNGSVVFMSKRIRGIRA